MATLESGLPHGNHYGLAKKLKPPILKASTSSDFGWVLAYTQQTELIHFKPKPRVVIPLFYARICTYINTGISYSQPGGKYPLIRA